LTGGGGGSAAAGNGGAVDVLDGAPGPDVVAHPATSARTARKEWTARIACRKSALEF